jgi:hypothetical protein
MTRGISTVVDQGISPVLTRISTALSPSFGISSQIIAAMWRLAAARLT